MFCTCMSNKDHSRNKRDGYCTLRVNLLSFFRSRYFTGELHYSKPNRITFGRYGVQVTTRTKVYGFSFSPIPF